MPVILGLSGSLRQGSYNAALLRAAAAAAVPRGCTLDIRSIRDVPLYDADLQSRAFPASVAALKDALAVADGLLLASPEYNHSVPGVLKNAIDWMSRPSSDIGRVFAGKPVAIMGATTGAFGTVLAQSAWLPVLRALRMRIWTDKRLVISRAASVFDEGGGIVDEGIRQQLNGFVAGFVEFVASGVRA